MARWSEVEVEVEAEAPELAAAVRRLFDAHRHKTSAEPDDEVALSAVGRE